MAIAKGTKRVAENRKARHEYFIEDTYECGIALVGTEVKSIRAGKVNLNTATAADLQKLNGIGERKAEQIIAYREQKGGFKSIDELKEVSGIGDKTFDALKDQITV